MKNKIIFLILLLLAILVISGCGSKKDDIQDVESIHGLNDIVETDNLSFRLYKVELSKWKEQEFLTTKIDGNIPAKIHSMFLFFEIKNNGDNIEYVSNCGTLLFEDGSQYSFELQTATTHCGDYKILPKATIRIMSSFLFSDVFLYTGAKTWESVHGQKIIYFSEQSFGYIKFTIDKNEIEYTIEGEKSECDKNPECNKDLDCASKEFKSCDTIGKEKDYNDVGTKCIECQCVPICRYKQTNITQPFYQLRQ